MSHTNRREKDLTDVLSRARPTKKQRAKECQDTLRRVRDFIIETQNEGAGDISFVRRKQFDSVKTAIFVENQLKEI